jgi:hypothetical protein
MSIKPIAMHDEGVRCARSCDRRGLFCDSGHVGHQHLALDELSKGKQSRAPNVVRTGDWTYRAPLLNINVKLMADAEHQVSLEGKEPIHSKKKCDTILTAKPRFKKAIIIIYVLAIKIPTET